MTTPVNIELKPSLRQLVHVVTHLRPEDKEELFATEWDDDPLRFADGVHKREGLKFLFLLDKEPVAFLGASELWPGFWTVYAFGTDKWGKTILSLTKTVKRVMLPIMIYRGMRRAQAATLASHVSAHRWMEHLGGYKESEMPGFGRDGQTFYEYVITPETARIKKG